MGEATHHVGIVHLHCVDHVTTAGSLEGQFKCDNQSINFVLENISMLVNPFGTGPQETWILDGGTFW